MLKRTSLAFAVILVGLIASSSLAQTGPELLLRPWPKGQRVEGLTNAYFFDSGNTTHDEDFQLQMYNAQGRFRLLPEQRAEPRVGFDIKYLDVDTTEPSLPSKFTDVSVGFGMGIFDSNGWIGGMTIGVGYAGAGAFDDGNAYYGQADLLFGHKIDETSDIGVVLDYNGNRSFLPDVPLPGFLYTKVLDTTMTLGLGVPYSSINWKPAKENTWDRQLTVDLRLEIPDSFRARVDYEFIKTVGLFASYGQDILPFHSDNLAHAHDRIFFEQSRVEGGVIWTPCEWVRLTAAAGYAFDQEFNFGWDTQDVDRLAKPDDAPYFRVGVEAHF